MAVAAAGADAGAAAGVLPSSAGCDGGGDGGARPQALMAAATSRRVKRAHTAALLARETAGRAARSASLR
jgi:hypothetical protein